MTDMKKKLKVSILLGRGIIYLTTAIIILLLFGMLFYIAVKGIGGIDWEFISTAPSSLNETYGILPMIINTVYIIIIGLLLALPIGIGGAIYLAEYAKKGRIVNIIRSTIEILAGIPSIVYGLFGSVFFVVVFRFGYSILAGAFTLAIMVLPTLIRTTEEALLSVDKSYREAATSMGVSKIYILTTISLPCAIPGILSGTILSIGRMVGETAALLYTSSIAYTMPVINNLADLFNHSLNSGATLSVQLYLYASEGGTPDKVIFGLASVLILLVLVLNLTTGIIGARLRKGTEEQ